MRRPELLQSWEAPNIENEGDSYSDGRGKEKKTKGFSKKKTSWEEYGQGKGGSDLKMQKYRARHKTDEKTSEK